jgi:3-phenylpropionate/cinnamic acid dioxygenase small subunit
MSALHSPELYFEVKSFLAQETALLQELHYERWLELLTADVKYRVPVMSVTEERASAESADGELMLFDDTIDTLKLRVARAKSRMAWTEIPPSRIRYFVDPIAIVKDGDDVLVTSNLMVYQTRLQREENFFVGSRRDRLRKEAGAWKLAERYAVIDKTVLQSKNLTVFF